MGKEDKNKPRYVAKCGMLATVDLVKISKLVNQKIDQEFKLIKEGNALLRRGSGD